MKDNIEVFWKKYLNILSKQLNADVMLLTNYVCISSDSKISVFCQHQKQNSFCKKCPLYDIEFNEPSPISVCWAGITSLCYPITLPSEFNCKLIVRFRRKKLPSSLTMNESYLGNDSIKEFNRIHVFDHDEYRSLIQTITFLKNNVLPVLIEYQNTNYLMHNFKHNPFLSNKTITPKDIVLQIAEQMYNEPCADYSLDMFSKTYFISKSHLSAEFKKILGITFVDFLNNARIKKSISLLTCSHLPIKKVAVLSGFSDCNYFYKKFKKTVGMTPKEFRQHFPDNDFF